MKQRWEDPEYRESQRKAHRGEIPLKKDEQEKEANRRPGKGRWTPEKREAFSQRMKERAQQPDFSEIRSKAAQKHWSTPGRKVQASESQNRRYADPEAKSRHSAAMARPETRAKIAEATRQFWATLTPEQRREKIRKMRRPLKGGQLLTTIEAEVLMALNDLEKPYFIHKDVGTFYVDIIVPSHNLVIECDGFWYHSKPEEKHRDAERDKQLISDNWDVLRLKESEIKDGTFLPRLRQALNFLVFLALT
jgi:uncharacterized protein DUF559